MGQVAPPFPGLGAGAWRLLAAAALAFAASKAEAGEGASSNYQPGTYGDFGLASPNDPGLEATILTFHADLSARIVDPATGAPADLAAKVEGAALNIAWTAPWRWHGLTFAAGATAPLLRVDAAATLDFGLFGQFRTTDRETGLGDIAVSPLTVYGQAGDFYWSLAEHVTLPTGRFRADRIASPGRGHWSFDTVGAASWLDLDAGFEIAGVAGLLLNASNPETDYRSGPEAHLDVSANVLIGDGFALGATVYAMRQLADDSGAGAGADPLRGRLFGAGLQAFWSPDAERFTPYVTLKWLHDFDARDRLSGDTIFLTAAFPLN